MGKKIFLAALFFVFFSGTDVKAIGISPGTIRYDDLVNGMEINHGVYISRKNADKTVTVKVSARGETARYIKLGETTLTWPQGQDRLSYGVIINPTHAPNGKYEGLVSFVVTGEVAGSSSSSLANGGSGTSFQEGASVNVIFTVTDKEVKMLKVDDLRVEDTEISTPPAMRITVKNEGNVDARFTKIKTAFVDVTDPSLIVEDELKEDEIPLTRALGTSDVQVKMHKNLALGRYKGKIEVYMDNVVIFTKNDAYVEVYPLGTLAQKAEFTLFKAQTNKFEPNELVKFTGLLKNAGQISIEPLLYIDLKKDDKLIDSLRSESKVILSYSDSEYDMTYRPAKSGKYIAEAHFEYGAKKTSVISFAFVVGGNKIIYYVIGGGVFLVLLVFIIYFFVKKKSKNDSMDDSTGANLLVS